MNKNIYLLILFALVFSLPFSSSAQNNKNVGIGTTNPDPSAVLDITSTDKGVLVPRLNSAQISAISTPAEGLMVYNTDSACYFYYNNFVWASLCHTAYANNGVHIGIVTGNSTVQLGGPLTQNTDVPLAGKKLTFSTVATGGNVGMGTNSPDPSAILDLSNTNSMGLLVPKVPLVQTNTKAPVTNPAIGLLVFNISAQNDVTPGYYFWDAAKWVRLFSSNLPVVSTVSVTTPIVNTGTAQDPNIGITTSDLTGPNVVSVTGGANRLTGAGGAVLDVVGTGGGVLYGTGTSSSFTPAGTSGQYLQSQAAGAPVWATGSDLTGSSVINVLNGAGQGVGSGNVGIDVLGTSGGVMYGTGGSSAFTPAGTTGYLLQSNGAGAPSWVNPNAALVVSNLVGSPVVSVTNGTGKAVGAGNAGFDVVGANGGVLYGTGTSSGFTPAGTAGQILKSTGAGAPIWSSPNATITTNNVTGGSVMSITNGNSQVVGGVNMNLDVAGTNGGVLYGTGPSSAFSAVGTSGQVLKSNGAAAPTWVAPNTTLTTTSITGSGPITITNGANQTVGASNPSVDIRGTAGGVLYGTGAGTSAAFSAVGTTGQLLQSNGAGIPTWVNPPTSVAASNGLHVSATPDVQLGGNLTSTTTITQAGFSLSASGGTINLNDASNNPVNIATSTSTGAVNIANGGAGGPVNIGTANTMTVTGSKVGINQPIPSQTLDVNGNVKFSNALMPAGLPGTTGQVLKSQGAGTAPVWGSPSGVGFSMPCNATATNLANNSTAGGGGWLSWSFAGSPAATLLNDYVYNTAAMYQATAPVNFLRASGWVLCQTNPATFTVFMVKYAGTAAGVCGAGVANGATQVPTVIGTCSLTAYNATTIFAGKFSIDVTAAPVALAAGDIVVFWIQNTSGAARTVQATGTADFVFQ